MNSTVRTVLTVVVILLIIKSPVLTQDIFKLIQEIVKGVFGG